MSDVLEGSLITVAKGAGIVFIGMFIGNLLGIGNQILLGRFLGVEIYGLFSLSLSIASLAATLAVFGLFTALPRFIPFYLEKGEKAVVKSSIRFSLIFVLCTSISISFIMYIFSGRVSIDIFHNADLEIALIYFFIGLPLIAVSKIFYGVLQAFKAVKYRLLIYDVGIRLSKMIVFIPLILAGYKLFGAIAAYFAGTMFTILVSFEVIRKKLFADHSKYGKAPVAKQLMSFAWPLSLSGITFLFASQTDVLLIGYYLTSRDVGIYMPAFVIAGFLNFIGSSFGYIFLPVISGLFAKGKMNDIESIFKSVSKWMFMIILPMFVFLVLFPEEIITLFYGFDYVEGYAVLIILSFGIFSNIFTGLTRSIIIGGGKPKLNLICEVIAAMTNISLNLILIPRYGIVGAAIGTSISFLARNLASLIFVYKTIKIHPYNKKYVKIALSGLVVLILFYLIKTQIYFNLSLWIYLISVGLLLLGVYTILIIFSKCLDKNDILILKLFVKRFGLKIKRYDRL